MENIGTGAPVKEDNREKNAPECPESMIHLCLQGAEKPAEPHYAMNEANDVPH